MKVKSIKNLKKEADRVFSIFIRLRDRDTLGETVCYTCGHKGDMKKMQNGHFVPRQYLPTRYNEINCHAQCYACNMLYNGQPSAYAERLRKEFGDWVVSYLEKLRRQVVVNFPYQLVIDYYKQKLTSLGYGYLI